MRRKLAALAATLCLAATTAAADHDPDRIHWRGQAITMGVVHPVIGHNPLNPYVYVAQPVERPAVREHRLGVTARNGATVADRRTRIIERCSEEYIAFDPAWLSDGRFDEFSCRLGDDNETKSRDRPEPPAPAPTVEPEPEQPKMDKPKRGHRADRPKRDRKHGRKGRDRRNRNR